MRGLRAARARAIMRAMAQDVYVRLPAGLHSELRRRAAEQGVSLNQLCVALLAGGIGFRLEGTGK